MLYHDILILIRTKIGDMDKKEPMSGCHRRIDKKEGIKSALPWNVEIFGDMDKKIFCPNNLKKRRFRRNVDIFGYPRA